ncbi:MAG: NADH-ubiquinone oxidoreductase-F iron-sulfur binding region domain-containing protein, partial [Candidatus Marinimicrobia bacterium]|nr:NADH-ubiquinone oxidoreductase-F iron-sulfur binding region domain-containing protein [Candidatus Neomarinimicrobiota bacterium]
MIKRIKIGTGSCGLAAGAAEIFDFFKENISDIDIIGVGCIGHCYAEPLVEVETDQGSVFFEKVEPKQAFIDKILNLEESSRLGQRQERSDRELIKVTKLAGRIDPISIGEYFENGGYDALKKASTMQPIDVVNEVKTSGLRGRGGAGFSTGIKWGFLHAQKTAEKVLICNADEGDPGAFMDRSLMESVPHQVLEGMLIAAHATGATQIFIYCRAEYPLAIKHLKIAIKQVIEHGLNKINGSDITIKIKEGAGAFVCGEETAMIHSLEGSRGTPRFRPPYPTDSGFKGLPTMINNVETFANIPIIIKEGGEEFAKVGTANSKGTKLFALAGDLKYPGLVEVPMGITLGEVVYEIGGVEKGSIKAVQIGGPSGGCIPFDHFDVQIDYDSLKSLGAIMGSGGLIFIGNNRCMVETARYFLDFTARESCGNCTFCRVGTKRMLETLEKITAGDGHPEDIEFLQNLGQKIIKGSLCGLGQSAPNPV